MFGAFFCRSVTIAIWKSNTIIALTRVLWKGRSDARQGTAPMTSTLGDVCHQVRLICGPTKRSKSIKTITVAIFNYGMKRSRIKIVRDERWSCDRQTDANKDLMGADFNAPSYRAPYCFNTLDDSNWSQ